MTPAKLSFSLHAIAERIPELATLLGQAGLDVDTLGPQLEAGLPLDHRLETNATLAFCLAHGLLGVAPTENLAGLIRAASSRFSLEALAATNASTRVQAPQHAYAVVDNSGTLNLQSPAAHASLSVEDPQLLAFWCECRTAQPAGRARDFFADAWREVVAMLICAGALELEGRGKTAPPTWEFHDLLLHTRSRMRHPVGETGATWRFGDQALGDDAIKAERWESTAHVLPRPDISAPAKYDAPLAELMTRRSSTRQHGQPPVNAEQLGEFLARTARVSGVMPVPGETRIRRPYPSAGGIYENEFYALSNTVTGLERGLYYYDGLAHSLNLVSRPNDTFEAILTSAAAATPEGQLPQVLIVISSRFSRMSRKYAAVSYALQLKNVGVILGYMYLVGESMGLATCAIGSGNSDDFADLSGLAYLEEGAIGEFIIGRP